MEKISDEKNSLTNFVNEVIANHTHLDKNSFKLVSFDIKKLLQTLQTNI